MLRATLLGVVALVIAMPALGASPPRQSDLEAEIVCPTCKTTLDQSSSPVAVRMKSFIRERIAAGDTSAQIKAQLVDQFGSGVLAEPPKHGFDLLAWLVPLGALGGGAVAVGALAWTWSRRRDSGQDVGEAPLDPELEQRLDDELGRYDA